jgi:choline dehydrogenase-like flavoprotein
VVDASVLPSAGALNTALTINALALRAGEYIANS